MWYPDSEWREAINTDEQQRFNQAHFPSTLFGGPEMQFTIEVSVMNSDPGAKLLFHDILKVAPECETEVLDKEDMGMTLDGLLVQLYPKTMQEAEAIVQFFRNSTYWQVEYVNMSWGWEYE